MTQVGLFDQIAEEKAVKFHEGDDPLTDLILGITSQVDTALDNLSVLLIDGIDDTLYDSMLLSDSARKLIELSNVLKKGADSMNKKSGQILEDAYKRGDYRDGNLAVEKEDITGNQRPNTALLKKERPDQYKLLQVQKLANLKLNYDESVKEIEDNFVPTLQEIKGLLKKYAKNYLLPGEKTGERYVLKVILREGERA
ncbi:MAG TPA: hypothetical protein VN429_04990 [Methanospirillum sp.]|uniref:hypothetical protein n=1 Tax=Methanospirillum sp. TaxID=45200 RepID=UPI002C1B5D10|nr:hypothetical protein [Methanospirillum sp.]HWQ63751.1 hypothetical protein [Methanospirillum sp.]